MGKLIRCITSEGAVMVSAVDSTDIVAKAEQIHKTSAVVTAALGRMLTAVSMMGNMLKGKDNSISVKIDGGGPTGAITVSSDSDGNVRGYAVNSVVEIPLKPNGKLDVSAAVGRDGNLFVVKDLGMKEAYNGFVPIVSGEIAEDITEYFATSEQTPTVCALGVRVDNDNMCFAAGGYIIQLMPGFDDADVDRLETNVNMAGSISKLIADGMDGDDIVAMLFEGIEYEMFDEFDIDYLCTCNRDKYLRALVGLGEDDMNELRSSNEPVETNCRFCGKKYTFELEEIDEARKLAKENTEE